MSEYRDLADIFDPHLYLPIAGKRYRVAAPSKAHGDELRALFGLKVDPEHERAEITRLLGPTLEQMTADGVTDPEIMHAGRTALIHFGAGTQLGLTHWHLGQFGQAYSLAQLLAALVAQDARDHPAPPTGSGGD